MWLQNQQERVNVIVFPGYLHLVIPFREELWNWKGLKIYIKKKKKKTKMNSFKHSQDKCHVWSPKIPYKYLNVIYILGIPQNIKTKFFFFFYCHIFIVVDTFFKSFYFLFFFCQRLLLVFVCLYVLKYTFLLIIKLHNV